MAAVRQGASYAYLIGAVVLAAGLVALYFVRG
jgi:hypothetical protein